VPVRFTLRGHLVGQLRATAAARIDKQNPVILNFERIIASFHMVSLSLNKLLLNRTRQGHP